MLRNPPVERGGREGRRCDEPGLSGSKGRAEGKGEAIADRRRRSLAEQLGQKLSLAIASDQVRCWAARFTSRSIQTFNGQATARMLQPMVAVSSCRVSTPAHIHVSPQPATRVQSLSHAALLDLAASFAFRSAEEQAHERGEQKAREQAIVTGPEQVGGECLAAGLYRNSSKARSRQTPVFDSRNTGDLAPGCGCH
ncbi:hypothetical protein TgHK011_006085 [Trichoderma gracile]|nr:hypothetical protein TgHK011_006085 [Trichoderma gracile]